jgi:hypothetical protein
MSPKMQRPSHLDKNVPTKRSSHMPRSARSAGAGAVLRARPTGRKKYPKPIKKQHAQGGTL